MVRKGAVLVAPQILHPCRSGGNRGGGAPADVGGKTSSAGDALPDRRRSGRWRTHVSRHDGMGSKCRTGWTRSSSYCRRGGLTSPTSRTILHSRRER